MAFDHPPCFIYIYICMHIYIYIYIYIYIHICIYSYITSVQRQCESLTFVTSGKKYKLYKNKKSSIYIYIYILFVLFLYNLYFLSDVMKVNNSHCICTEVQVIKRIVLLGNLLIKNRNLTS